MRRVNDIKDYIVNTFPLHPDKFDVIKIGSAIWLYAIDRKIQLKRFKIFSGSLVTIDESEVLKKYLLDNILKSIIELGYVNPGYQIDYKSI